MLSCIRGDIYLVDCEGEGHEQRGRRPGVIIQNDVGNHYSPTTIVAYITSRSKASLPTHVTIDKEIMYKNSIIMLEQIQTVDKKRLSRYISHLSTHKIDEINKALHISLGL